MVRSILQKAFNQRDLAVSFSKLAEKSDQNSPPSTNLKEGTSNSQEMMDKILQAYAREDLKWKMGFDRYS